MLQTIITNSEQETFEFARKYAAELQTGGVIAVSGELGTGKTVLAQGLARGLGVTANVSSPTFVIMRVYAAALPHIKTFCHIDAYRVNSYQDLLDIGAQDYFRDPRAISLVEWAEKAEDALPSTSQKIELKHLSLHKRQIILS